ncbi:alkaline phosphatase synthesis transcriptional regulatory protein PhoP [Nocardioidaceae bacterium Broad-1]|nr:alkaline phosphatase synthesis transcriptional regulatory protein PhoP [Nocardioidaceae bacterium Broad-1]
MPISLHLGTKMSVAISCNPLPRALYLPNVGSMIEVQEIKLDPETRRAWRNDEELTLSRKEFDLVHALIKRAGDVVSRDELMRDVWNATFYTSSKTIDVHLGWVRRKLGDDPRKPHLITTLRGKGLRFEKA